MLFEYHSDDDECNGQRGPNGGPGRLGSWVAKDLLAPVVFV